MLPRIFEIWSLVVGLNTITLIMAAIFMPPLLLPLLMLVTFVMKLYNYYAAVTVELQVMQPNI